MQRLPRMHYVLAFAKEQAVEILTSHDVAACIGSFPCSVLLHFEFYGRLCPCSSQVGTIVQELWPNLRGLTQNYVVLIHNHWALVARSDRSDRSSRS